MVGEKPLLRLKKYKMAICPKCTMPQVTTAKRFRCRSEGCGHQGDFIKRGFRKIIFKEFDTFREAQMSLVKLSDKHAYKPTQ